MKNLIILLLSIIVLSTCSSETINRELVEKREDGLTYYKESDSLVTGIVARKFDDGILASKTNYINGKEVGEWYFYDHGGEKYIAGQGMSVHIPKVIIDKFPNLYLTNTTLSFGTEDINKPFHYHCGVVLLENAYNVADEVSISFVNEVYQCFKNKYDFDEVSIYYEYSNEVYYDFKNLPLNSNDYKKDTADLYGKFELIFIDDYCSFKQSSQVPVP